MNAEKHELGRKYAELAVTYARAQPDGDLDRHALGAFILSDTASDGKRDFTDAQARVHLTAALKSGRV